MTLVAIAELLMPYEDQLQVRFAALEAQLNQIFLQKFPSQIVDVEINKKWSHIRVKKKPDIVIVLASDL